MCIRDRINVQQLMIKDFKSLLEKFFKKKPKSTQDEAFTISKYKIFLYKGHNGTVSTNHSLHINTQTFIIKKQSVRDNDIDLSLANRLYFQPIPVNPKKVADVLKLCNKYVPPVSYTHLTNFGQSEL